MSWEVSSMPSKRSSFNWTLFKKDLSRFWPLWGGVTLAGSLIPLYLLLELMSHTGPIKDLSLDFVRFLYGAVTAFAPAFIMCYAILCAMVVWSYLCSARSVGMMHALPVDRRCLYLTGTMAGLTMLVIPFAVVGGLLCLVMACFGGFAPLAVLETVAAVLLMILLFFGLATVCAMITGNIFAIPVLYLLINFLAPLLDALVGSLTSLFLMGVEGSGTGLTFLSPVMAIYENFTYTAEYDNMTGEWAELRLEGMAVVAVCGLLGAALLALGYLMYRRRQSESAGDVVAFRFLRPVFRYGLALLSALSLGRLLYAMLWESVFQKGLYADVVPMGVSLALAGIVGYYVASMLLEKSRRVFRGSWPGVLTVCAGAVILCCLVSVDFFGVEAWVPEKDEVASVDVYGGDYMSLAAYQHSITLSTATDGELIDQVLDIHRTVLASKDDIRELDRYWSTGETGDGQEIWWNYLTLDYTLTDGSQVRRVYDLPALEEDLTDGNSWAGKLSALLNSPELAVKTVELPVGAQLTTVDVYPYYEELFNDSLYFEGDDARLIYDALLADAQAGNMSQARTSFEEDSLDPVVELYLGYTLRTMDPFGQAESSSDGQSVLVYASMTNTMETLMDLGAFTQADLEAWAETYG